MSELPLHAHLSDVEQSELGKKSQHDETYNPDRLYPLPRAGKRIEIGIDPEHLPFYGFDCWNHYEVSWLNPRGKPIVAIAEIFYDCHSPYLIESKSLKLYFNALNQTKFTDIAELQAIIQGDLQDRVGANVVVNIHPLNEFEVPPPMVVLQDICLDDIDIDCSIYTVDSSFLSVSDQQVEEVLYSNLLKSNCLVTNQPDWGSVQIAYTGKKIDRAGLLRYLVSYRNHNEFHEQCIERIFIDIMNLCKPQSLTVYGRYTRRGGLDINPYRSTEKTLFPGMNFRLLRQ